MATRSKEVKFAICIREDDCDDIERGKVYQVLPDSRASKDGYLRIIDNSGEDYLYPEAYFSLVEIPARARQALTSAR